MERYSRQTILGEIGLSGQQKLHLAKVAIVGCGGLGNIAAPYLAGAGVGKLILIDGDEPSISNLHRQVFLNLDSGNSKAYVLADRLRQLNPDINIEIVEQHLIKDTIEDHLIGTDLVLECSDDIQCKYLVNDFCHIERIPLVYAAIHKFEGYLSLFKNSSDTDIHLRDIFSEPSENIPTCAEVGVFNTIAGIIGILQANEALKFLLDIGETLEGILLNYSALNNEQLKLKLKKNWKGDLEEIFEISRYEAKGCDAKNEIEIEKLLALVDEYTIVSLLGDAEHVNISEKVIRGESDSLEGINIFDNKPVVFYCRSGYQSGLKVLEILAKHPQAKVFSLKGGLKAYRKLKVSH